MCGAGAEVDADVVACGRVPVRPSLGEGHPRERRYHHSLVGWQLQGPYWKINVHLCIWSHLMKPDPVTWFLVHWVKVTLQLKSSTHQGPRGWVQHEPCSMLLLLLVLFHFAFFCSFQCKAPHWHVDLPVALITCSQSEHVNSVSWL